MPRTARIVAPDLAHHVMVRGIERGNIFRDDLDRRDLLDRLVRVLCGSGARCYAWALMPNHFHLVLQPGEVPLSRLMARINTGYARRFNDRYGRVGHLCQGRFKSRIVEDEADLAGVIRYVHLNPLAGGIVGSLDALERFRWCGHGGLLGRIAAEAFHSVTDAMALFADGNEDARARLRAWMEQGWTRGLPPESLEPDEPARGGGTPVARLRSTRWEETVEAVCVHLGVERSCLRPEVRMPAAARARALLAHLGVQRLGLGVCEVAALMGMSAGAVSRAVARGGELADRDVLQVPRPGIAPR
jgi:REP element-mobilizing transposase RayT